jgi:outer membrane protein OmpA-like peptidoglycan-associated protein
MLCGDMTDVKRTILARRARFLTAAMVGCTPSATPLPGRSVEPGTAQSIVIPPLADADATPTVASSVPTPVAADRDNDGVLDMDDACPDEPGHASPKPGSNGCPQVVVSVCLSIVAPPKMTFPMNGVTPSSTALVDEVARILTNNPQVNVTVEGHTDNGEPASLGQQRADVVKALLVKRGVAQTRMTTSNAGSAKPIAPNTTEVGRAKNRRVELIVR